MMNLDHDFKKFPELTNQQLEYLELSSPHKQIKTNFYAAVVKVHDGDTVTLQADARDFDFPLRLVDIDAPELSEGGHQARNYLRSRIEGQEVYIKINPQNRVGKYGRLLGSILHGGADVAHEMYYLGLVSKFGKKNEGQIPASGVYLGVGQWL